MKSLRVLLVCSLLAFANLSGLFGQEPLAPQQDITPYPNPSRLETVIKAFEAESKAAPPPEGAIVAIGSSSMRIWSTIQEDLAPLKIIHRGFGGSTMYDALHFADRIVLPYRPRAVLIYEGDNDAIIGISPERISEAFNAFVAKIHDTLPNARIYVIAIKPSVNRWKIWDAIQRANELLEATCDADPLLTFIDVAAPMLDEEGRPKAGIFLSDNLHMNEKGYHIWKEAIRPVLIEHELKFEK
jgi:lysophospholipase L1-like esterase